MSSRRFTGSAKKTSTPSNSVEFYRIRIIFRIFHQVRASATAGAFLFPHESAWAAPDHHQAQAARTLPRGGKTGSDAGPSAKTRISKEAGESPNGARCATSSAATFFLGLSGAFESRARVWLGASAPGLFLGIRI